MRRVEKAHLPVAALTHPGMKGKNNEDRFGVSSFRTTSKPPIPVLLAVLSDGIGGNRAGEIASEMAVNLISQFAAESDGQSPTRILEDAILLASSEIFHQAQENVEQHGMGATCACAWIAGNRLYTATVGDSRIYLMRDQTIQQISIDHTWIQEALERGLLQPEQVNGHPNAHVIRRYLGSPNPPEVDFRMRINQGENDTQLPANQGVRLQPGDRVLLCSDGLTDLVSDQEILEKFQKMTMDEAGRQLVDLANERGGHDNITLVAVQIPEQAPKAVAAPAPAAPVFARSVLAGCLTITALAVIVGGLAGSYMLGVWGGRGTETPTPQPLVTITSLPSPTRTTAPTRTATRTPTPLRFASSTPTLPVNPGTGATITPVRVSSPTPPLPVVTLNP